jgi:hypothetical protein
MSQDQCFGTASHPGLHSYSLTMIIKNPDIQNLQDFINDRIPVQKHNLAGGGGGGVGEEPYQASVVKCMMGELQHLQQHL